MSEQIDNVIQASGVIRIRREGAETPVSIPANGILQVSVSDGASVTIGGGGATQLVGIEYVDENGDQVVLDSSLTDAKFFRVAQGVTITVLHNRSKDLAANTIPEEQRILTSSGVDFKLEPVNTQAFFAYAAPVAGFRWTFAHLRYFDADQGVWEGSPPTDDRDAIARMALALSGVLGGPIPAS